MRNLIIGVIATAFLATTATVMAQTKPQPKPRSTASLECSKQADEKGLHGKPRKTFRSQCLKSIKTKTG
jgi:hypothetical protein